MTLATASFWVYAIHNEKMQTINLSDHVYPITGGEQVLPRVERQINSFLAKHGSKAKLIVGWGMCELGSTISSTSTAHSMPGSVGFPILSTTVAVFDPKSGREMRYGERGELRVCSPTHMKGYYRNPSETAAFFKADAQGNAWGCTGDMGYMDEEGNVFILGRINDYYTAPDGSRHYLFDAENVILQEEAVDFCEVVDIPIARQPTPVAHLMLNKECQDAPEEVIHRVDALCRAQLPEYAVPVAYKFRDSFPVKPSGKRDADALKAKRDGFMDASGHSLAL